MKLPNNEGERITHHRNPQTTKAVGTLRFLQQTLNKASLLKTSTQRPDPTACSTMHRSCSGLQQLLLCTLWLQSSVFTGIPKCSSGFLTLCFLLGSLPALDFIVQLSCEIFVLSYILFCYVFFK